MSDGVLMGENDVLLASLMIFQHYLENKNV